MEWTLNGKVNRVYKEDTLTIPGPGLFEREDYKLHLSDGDKVTLLFSNFKPGDCMTVSQDHLNRQSTYYMPHLAPTETEGRYETYAKTNG